MVRLKGNGETESLKRPELATNRQKHKKYSNHQPPTTNHQPPRSGGPSMAMSQWTMEEELHIGNPSPAPHASALRRVRGGVRVRGTKYRIANVHSAFNQAVGSDSRTGVNPRSRTIRGRRRAGNRTKTRERAPPPP